MLKPLFAVLAALALFAAAPVLACDENCPHHKGQAASTSKKGDQAAKADCPCAGAKNGTSAPEKERKAGCHCHKGVKGEPKADI